MEEKKVKPEIIYLATYAALIDNRLYDQEWFQIEQLIHLTDNSEYVRNNVMAIVKNLPDKKTLDDVIDSLGDYSIEIKKEAMAFAMEIAFQDDILMEKEELFFQNLRNKLGIDRKEYERIKVSAKENVKNGKDSNTGLQDELNQRYGNCLFSSRNYAKTIEDLKDVSTEDMKFVSEKLKDLEKLYERYPEIFQKQNSEIKKYTSKLTNVEDKKKMDDFFKLLLENIEDVLDDSRSNVEVLEERQASAIESYTISFMGRTKAGKSTLHSILLGGINNDFIGNGSERTTRYNYVYDFHGLRIIDTPGIGAPGGQEDTAIAEEVADESDLICYVVTTDSIQETEFDFLKKLKNRNKPVLILLNKKENFARSAKKKQAFIDNPLAWFESDGEDSIQGHIDRINTYMTMNYDFHNFKVIPLHLLAAKLSLTEEDEYVREQLKKGSRIDEFLNEICDTIVSIGKIQKSQTIYNSSVYHAEESMKTFAEQEQTLKLLREELQKTAAECSENLKKIGLKTRNEMINAVNNEFDLFIANEVMHFAAEHYADNPKQVSEEWEKYMKSEALNDRMKSAYESVWERYQDKVQDVLLTAEEDINFNASFGRLSNIKMVSLIDWNTWAQVASIVLGVVGMIISGPVFWVLTGVSLISILVTSRFKKKKALVSESQDKLYSQLTDYVEGLRENNLKELLKKYDEARSHIEKSLEEYYSAITSTLENVENQLSTLQEKQKECVDELNRAFGARIVNYTSGRKSFDIMTPDSIKELKVEREFRKNIRIYDPKLFILPRVVSSEQASEVLQEKIELVEEDK